MSARTLDCDVAVVGAGMAGMAAALFAAGRGLRTVQVGNAGGLLFSSGLLDLMAVHPIAERRVWDDPWAAIEAVVADEPGHPYARVDRASIEEAFALFLSALAEAGLPYAPPDGANREVLSSLGTTKRTWAVPLSMMAGVDGLRERPPGLIVAIRGLRELSARQVVETLSRRWPGLRAVQVALPRTAHASEVYAAHVARALELAESREAFAELLRPHLGDARVLGLPAVLGIRRVEAVREHLERLPSLRVFEIPTMPTSVPGLRLKEGLETVLSARGVRRVFRGVVTEAGFRGDGGFELVVGAGPDEERIRARGVVLATGRFTGRGLVAERTGIREAVFGLPVRQPASRGAWHRADFLDPAGHPVNRAGLEVDAGFRPLGTDGRPAAPALYAVGSLLAHQDWMRMKCGAGLAIATAYAAVRHFSESQG